MKKVFILAIALAATAGVSSVQAEGNNGRGEKPAFSDVDANNDGKVTQAELTQFRQAKGAERFAAADTNNDGKLSTEELTAAAEGRRARRIEKMMDRMDANNDGFLEQSEMQPREGRGGRMFNHADKDDDGALSQAEFEAMGKRGGHRR